MLQSWPRFLLAKSVRDGFVINNNAPKNLKDILKLQKALLKDHSSDITRWRVVERHEGINALYFEGKDREKQKTPIVLLHGYGAGSGMFFNDIKTLESTGRSIYLVDWLGFGGSDRVKIPNCSERSQDKQKVIDYFIKPLHGWMSKVILNGKEEGGGKETKVTLIGHSLGGFLVGKFASTYLREENLHKILLVSPVGLYGSKAAAASSSSSSNPYAIAFLNGLYNLNVTPQVLLRNRFIKERMRQGIERRFGRYVKDGELIGKYLWELNTNAQPAGEFAISSILHPPFQRELMAYLPLSEDEGFFRKKFHLKTNVLFGERDWVLSKNAFQSAEKVSNCNVHILKSSGHHLYLDKTDLFHRFVLG